MKISAVSYLNTKPFLHGIQSKGLDSLFDLSLDIPSVCAKKLIQGEADLGLVPVAVIPHISTPYIISDFCIGAEGAVKTVCLFAEKPIHSLKRIFLDYQSKTSVELTKILVKQYWKLNPEFVYAEKGYEDSIQGATGGLIIGDRAIGMEEKFPFTYDLGEYWTKWTGLPFVFAAWVSNNSLPKDFINQFNEALQLGISHTKEVAKNLQASYPTFDVHQYFTNYISYNMDSLKKKALTLFLHHIQQQTANTRKKELVFI